MDTWQQQPQPAPFVEKQQYYYPVRVIHSMFCLPYNVALTCTRSRYWLTDGGYQITDATNGKIIFNFAVKHLSLHKKRRLLDANGAPILTISKKLIGMHKTHFVYSGGKTKEWDLLFSLRKCSTSDRSVTTLDVFVGNNNRQDVPDFRVQGSWSQRSVILAGTSNIIIAHTSQDIFFQRLLRGTDSFTATVCSGIDHAFAVTLFLILADINHSAELRSRGQNIAGELANIVGGLAQIAGMIN